MAKKEKKEYFTDAQIEGMKREARETNGDYFEIYQREAEKILGKWDIKNLNQFLIDSHNNSDGSEVERFLRDMAEFDRKYPTEEARKEAINRMRKGYDV